MDRGGNRVDAVLELRRWIEGCVGAYLFYSRALVPLDAVSHLRCGLCFFSRAPTRTAPGTDRFKSRTERSALASALAAHSLLSFTVV